MDDLIELREDKKHARNRLKHSIDFYEIPYQIDYVKIEFLKKAIPQIERMGKKGKERMCKSFKEVHFHKDEIIFREGEQLNHFYLIKEGEVDLFCTKQFRGETYELMKNRFVF